MRRSVICLVLLVATVPASCGDDDPGRATQGSSGSTEQPAYVVDRVETGIAPCGILGVDGTLWVSNYGEATLVTVDPGTGKVGPPVPTGDQPCGLAFGAGSIWVEDYGSDEVTRVSVADGSVQATYEVGSRPYDVTFAGGAAWVTNYSDHSVCRIDAESGEVTRIRTGGTPIGIAPSAGKVWVGLGAAGIAAIDVATARVTDRIRTDGSAGWTAYDDDRVWVNVDDTVVELDPATATVIRTVQVGAKPEDGTVVGDQVWVGDGGGEVYRFPVDGDSTEAASVPSGVGNPFVAAELDGLLWLVDFSGSDVVAIDPAKVS